MYASPAIPFISTSKIAIPQSVIAIELDDELNDFIYYNLMYLKDKVLKLTMTGTQTNLNADIVKNIEIALPDEKTIVKIANLLSSMDKIIDLHKQELEQLKLKKKYYLNKIFN